jgi:hypothetical protein
VVRNHYRAPFQSQAIPHVITMNILRFQRVLPSIILLGLLGFTGCSSFKREWKQTLAQPSPVPVSGITGPWEGTWLSDANGHQGPLRCLITQGTNGNYQAWFRAKYKKVITLSYAYTVSLEAIQSDQDQNVVFSGEEDLGKLAGGVYRYEGKVNQTRFYSTYRCKYDHGTFQMSRPTLSGDHKEDQNLKE